MEAAIARDVDAACGLAASHIHKTLAVLDEIVVPHFDKKARFPKISKLLLTDRP